MRACRRASISEIKDENRIESVSKINFKINDNIRNLHY
jgi:hypothetical protein